MVLETVAARPIFAEFRDPLAREAKSDVIAGLREARRIGQYRCWNLKKRVAIKSVVGIERRLAEFRDPYRFLYPLYLRIVAAVNLYWHTKALSFAGTEPDRLSYPAGKSR